MPKPGIEWMPGLVIATRLAWREVVQGIYAEAPVVSQGFGVGWVEGRPPGWGRANVVTAPVAIACKTDNSDLFLSFIYSAETRAVAVTPAKVISKHPSKSISARRARMGAVASLAMATKQELSRSSSFAGLHRDRRGVNRTLVGVFRTPGNTQNEGKSGGVCGNPEPRNRNRLAEKMERAKGFEPSTFTLAT